MPLGWPPYYPDDLKALTTVIIGEALKKFTVQTQTLQLCKYVISRLTPHLCAAVQRKTLRADSALSVMGDLLHYLRVANCDDDNQRFRLHQETMKSDEWLKLAKKMARVHSAAVNDSSDTHLEIEGTEAPADNQPTEEALRETTTARLPKMVVEGKRCDKVIKEIRRIKFMHKNGGQSMDEIKRDWPNYEVWEIVEGLSKEDQGFFEKPGRWAPATGYAKLILSKHYGNSPTTITDWVKAYRKHAKPKKQKK